MKVETGKDSLNLSAPFGQASAAKAGGEARGAGRLFLVGFMGCGKSYWGRQLGPALGVPFIDLDERIEEHAGKSINEIFAEEGEEYFRQLEKETLHLLTESHSEFVMATGGGTPCFYKNIDYMKEKGRTLWINCSVECLHARLLTERDRRPLVRDLGEEQLRAYIFRKFGDRRIFYQQADITVETDSLKLAHLLDKIAHA
ncbi:shikimate kinase [Flaviaesturariibacter aridisoli]|uniref:Shikimate kinase n=1 Tax=Flaviaesturariibacter aridisoli TaxID=2545761 RepID=A0A4R4E8K1_9BACT|nr:shikimate kinase [Flaviaesturariibacter aridisoli]TCZ74431.1 shikimate kinase [Flaviaesturariibacter aridisoli]